MSDLDAVVGVELVEQYAVREQCEDGEVLQPHECITLRRVQPCGQCFGLQRTLKCATRYPSWILWASVPVHGAAEGCEYTRSAARVSRRPARSLKGVACAFQRRHCRQDLAAQELRP